MQRVFALSFNPLAHRILQIPVDLLHQHAVPFSSENNEENKILKEFWDDPINRMPEFSRQIIYEYGLYGELCFTVFTNPVSKRVRLGYINPFLIESIIVDPDNPRIPIGVQLVDQDNPYAKKSNQILTTIIDPEHNEADLFSPETCAMREKFTLTNSTTNQREQRFCFLFQENPHFDKASFQHGLSLRGTSDLVTIYDWALATDDILSSMIERADLLSRTLWTLQVEGGNLREGDELNLDTLKQRYGRIPQRWEVRVMNDKMKYERHDTPVGNSDMVALLNAVQLYIIGGTGYPETWFLGGQNSNRASSLTMEYPSLKKLEARQHTISTIYEILCKYQVIQAGIEPGFKMTTTPLKDTTQKILVESLKTLGESLKEAQLQGWLSDFEATTVYRKLVQDLGVKLKDMPDTQQAPSGSTEKDESEVTPVHAAKPDLRLVQHGEAG